MTNHALLAVLAYAFAINLLGYAAMALDKAKAERRARRISEATLLTLALLGGSLGTVLAQRTIRHKTRKEPFRSRLALILAGQTMLGAAALAGVLFALSP